MGVRVPAETITWEESKAGESIKVSTLRGRIIGSTVRINSNDESIKESSTKLRDYLSADGTSTGSFEIAGYGNSYQALHEGVQAARHVKQQSAEFDVGAMEKRLLDTSKKHATMLERKKTFTRTGN